MTTGSTGANGWDSGKDVVVEGTAVRVTDAGALQALADAWFAKYGDDWNFEVRGEEFVELSDSGGSTEGGAWVYRVARRQGPGVRRRARPDDIPRSTAPPDRMGRTLVEASRTFRRLPGGRQTTMGDDEQLRELHDAYAWEVNAAVGEGRLDLVSRLADEYLDQALRILTGGEAAGCGRDDCVVCGQPRTAPSARRRWWRRR